MVGMFLLSIAALFLMSGMACYYEQKLTNQIIKSNKLIQIIKELQNEEANRS